MPPAKSTRPRAVAVAIADERLACPAPPLRALCRALDTVGRPLRLPSGGLSLAIVDDATLARLHADFCHDPSPTDVITFPGAPGSGLAGEIVVSAEMAERMAQELGQPWAHELTLYFVHGWLHLAGLDDRTDEGRAEMRREEARLLAALAPLGPGVVPRLRWRRQP